MGLMEGTRGKEGLKIGVSEEILSYAERLINLGTEMIGISEDVDKIKKIIEQNAVYEGGAGNDIWFYYVRLNEMTAKIRNHYLTASQYAIEAYYALAKLDALIAGMFNLMGSEMDTGEKK